MSFRLISLDGPETFRLPDGATRVVGRSPTSDIPVPDPTISRRHAELTASGDKLTVRDLDSANGTFVEGDRIETYVVSAGAMLRFGQRAFRVEFVATPVVAAEVVAAEQHTPRAGATIVRQRPVSGADLFGLAAHAISLETEQASDVAAASLAVGEDKSRQKLAMLLQVSTALSRVRDVDALLEQIVTYAFHVLEVDRTAVLLLDADDRLHPRLSRDRQGADSTRPVPQSIARTAIDERIAIISDDAGEDARFGGQSVVLQQIRSAMCAPLVGGNGRPFGVLYVDSNSVTTRFADEDLEFLIAFAGIAAVALENSQFAARLQQEAVVRSNFERFFTPHLAARIASTPDAVRLGGDKRIVTVLFSDIRGFTALSETMNPDDMAGLLTEYFTEMVDCVFRHGGTLDKFIGDAVMAQWGAPLGDPDDADRALAAAIDMQRALAMLNARWRLDRRPELQIGIGLNTGEAFAGNIGSERRLEYTVIGDTVNTASRLCSVAAGGEIIVSEALRTALHAVPPMVEREAITLKGKSQPVPVYAVQW
jgi:adenylate cyclase